MKRFIVEQSNIEIYTSHAGLALIGRLINTYTSLKKSARRIKKRHGIPNIELIRSYLGQLCLGKSDFDAIEDFRHDRFFKEALGIKQMPSSSRLRQRFNEDARELIDVIDEANVEFLQKVDAPISANPLGYVVIDADLFPMDNSGTRKEGVSRTYKDFDGYGAMAAYLGEQGWCIACELREGSWHSQKEFGYVLDRIVQRSQSLTDLPRLIRLDSAHDALENRFKLSEQGVDYLIKWNPRHQHLESWVDKAGQQSQWHHPREGKRVALFSEPVSETYKGKTHKLRRVIRVIERSIDKNGQRLLMPKISLEGWMTSLEADEVDDQGIIDCYKAHATSEQFHSEFKTDLDIERLPSGKFDTNDLVLTLATLAYNLLRWIGLKGLTGEDAPIRHPAKRRRLRTVMQEILYLAARLVQTGHRLKLKFSSHCPAFRVFERTYDYIAT